MNINIPENFNFPFLARTPQEFWTRWHMSLTTWCQDHIFFNLYRLNLLHFRKAGEWLILIPPIFVTFIIIGIWHGNTWAWFFYGVSHAIAIYLNALLKKPFGIIIKKLSYQNSILTIFFDNLGRIFTFSFVSLTLICVLPQEIMFSYLNQIIGL